MTLPLVLSLVAALAAPQMEPSPLPSAAAVSPPPAATTTAVPTAPVAPPTLDAPSPMPSAALPAPSAEATLPPSAYAYRFVPRQPASPAPGEPQIYAVYLNAKHLKSHGPIVIRVETNEYVVKVESKSNGRGGTIPQVAPMVFFVQSTLPGIPLIASGMSTDLIFTGTASDGRKVVVRVPIELG